MRGKITIAVDGHSSCGKSTLAKALARKLGFVYVDTGAMYRSVTLFCIRNGIARNGVVDEQLLARRIGEVDVSFKLDTRTGLNEVTLNGEVVENDIRGMEVSSAVSPVSKVKVVREKLVATQREIGRNQSIVMDGRDIGTVVFPDADLKIFMTAQPEVRARRRFDELTARGELVDYGEILRNVVDRDFQDENRAESPLRRAPDAILLDNSFMTREEQLAWITRKVEEKCM